MLGLDPSRYVAVLLKRCCYQKAFLIDPSSYFILSDEIRAITSRPDSQLESDTTNVRDFFLAAIKSKHALQENPKGWNDYIEVLEGLSFQSFSPIESLNPKTYSDSLIGSKIAVTELFDPQWKTLNIGSARNVLLKHVQIKGVGRTLPTNNLHHIFNSGRMSFLEATHSFIMSQLGNIMLPLGTLRAHGVLIDPEGDECLYVRAADGIRIAQIPFHPSNEELLRLRKSCESLHPGSAPDGITRRCLAQYASQFFLGLSYGSSPDNLILDGRILDEEGWDLRTNLGQLTVSFDIFHQGEKSDFKPEAILEYQWSDAFKVKNSIGSAVRSIDSLLKALRIVYPSMTLTQDDASEFFVDYLCTLNSEHQTVEERKLREIFKRGSRLDEKDSLGAVDFIKFLLELGFTGLIKPLRFNGRSQLRLFSPAAGSRQGSIGFHEYTNSLHQLHQDGFLASNSLKFTNDILMKIALKASPLNVFPDVDGYPITNTLPLTKWWEVEQKRMQEVGTTKLFHFRTRSGKIQSTDLFVSKGRIEINEDIEPLFMELLLRDGSILNLPIKKTYLRA